jgi:putative ABC transport system substrate-binding protein
VNPKLSAKLLQLLGEVVPRLSRVALIQNPDTSGNVVNLREVQGAAGELGLRLQPIEVRRSDKIERVFSKIANGNVEALIMAWPTPNLFMKRRRLGAFTQRQRLPTIFAQKEYVVAGGLISYGPSSTESHRRAAAYVDKILKGAKPASLPVERPTRFELVVNLKTAKTLGMTIPQSILLRADEVIE